MVGVGVTRPETESQDEETGPTRDTSTPDEDPRVGPTLVVHPRHRDGVMGTGWAGGATEVVRYPLALSAQNGRWGRYRKRRGRHDPLQGTQG